MGLTNFREELRKYLDALQKNFVLGISTEHTHRPTLKNLLEGISPGINAVNEPARIECGAPDFAVLKGLLPIGYIETKDLGAKLDPSENSEQIERYRASLSNFILSNFLEFRLYVGGAKRLSASLGDLRERKIESDLTELDKLEMLLNEFFSSTAPTIKRAEDLAIRMAELSKLFKRAVIETYKRESENGDLHSQMDAIKEILIPDLELNQFADIYAQTISYGMFAARCAKKDAASFTRVDATYCIPRTNPFLRKLFLQIAGPDLDERIAWIVDEIAELLWRSDMDSILKDFGVMSAKTDPVVHFYETFLSNYDRELRQKRGVFYTPTPVVSYIVKSIDYLLRESFERKNGISEPDILVLDPACGTGTFLYSTIDQIHSYFRGQEGVWNAYVSEKLLPRVFGFELLMAPYAIAHLKVGLQLQQLGYEFDKDRRLGIYLTNSLEEGVKKSEKLLSKWISEEANEAAEIKRTKPIMVVLGNPPYSKISANWNDWIVDLLEKYRQVDGKPLKERKVWLQDDYVKFFRFAQWRIERTGTGILAYITNHGYLDNPTFRGMRQSLMETFDDIYLLNLHGNEKKKEMTPSGDKDENVFDITQGVAIGIFVKTKKLGRRRIQYCDLWGLRRHKYDWLEENDVASIAHNHGWEELRPESPYYFFVPKDFALKKEYEACRSIKEIFTNSNVGFVTARDRFVIDFDYKALEDRIVEFMDLSKSDAMISDKYSLHDTSSWNLAKARKDLAANSLWKSDFRKCLYRPFDERHIYFSASLLERPVIQIQKHLFKPNVALLAHRPQSPTIDYDFVFCSDKVADQCSAGNKSVGAGITYAFPLWIYSNNTRRCNLEKAFISDMEKQLRISFTAGDYSGASSFCPEDIFNYIYAILHSPTYRERYVEFLKVGFPRIPLASDVDLFRKLAKKGGELVALHLMKDQSLGTFVTRFPISGSNRIEAGYPKHDGSTNRLYINEQQYFEGLPQNIFDMTIGGYKICDKWLRERKGKVLTFDEISVFQKVVVALKGTIEIMSEIDTLIEKWPLSSIGKIDTQSKMA